MALQSSFLFKSGQFLPIPDPEYNQEGQGEFVGYHKSQDVGDESGLSYALFESRGETPKTYPWLVAFFTAGQGCTICCDSWPDLIDVLGKLSPIATAATLDAEELAAVRELLRPTIDMLARRKHEHRQRA